VICYGGIDEWFLPIQRFRGTTTRKAIFLELLLYDFGEEFRNRAQPESVPPIPSIQRLS
jgi:hypothetical protein